MLSKIDSIEQSKDIDTLDLMFMVDYFAEMQEEELAFQAQYLAHLKNPEGIKTNSDVEFDLIK